jgi:uncharacterized membrane protein
VDLGLTPLGMFHTLISLIAVASGTIALWRDRQLVATNRVGRVFMIATLVTCFTGFFIFQHGGFGKPHALGVITLIVMGIAYLAGTTDFFGHASRYLEKVGLSLVYFFHWVPGITETLTRLPRKAPLANSPDDPVVQIPVAIAFVVFLIFAVLQVRKLRAEPAPAPVTPAA